MSHDIAFLVGLVNDSTSGEFRIVWICTDMRSLIGGTKHYLCGGLNPNHFRRRTDIHLCFHSISNFSEFLLFFVLIPFDKNLNKPRF